MNRVKSIAAVFVAAIFVLNFVFGAQTVFAEGSGDITLMLDENVLSVEQAPVIVDGRVMVQLRTVAEALGADVKWDPSLQKISIGKNSDNIELIIGSKTALLNGERSELDVAPFIGASGSTMVPLRFVSEAFGLGVSWNDNTVALASEGKSSENPVSSFETGDLLISIEGRNWGLMENAGSLIDIMGDSAECIESISCAYDGMDQLYTNEDLSVSVLPINGKDSQIIDEILLTSPKYSTAKGIRVGSSVQDVIETYGTDYTEQSGTMIYWAGEANSLKTPRMYFDVEDGKITSLGIFGARNAG